MLLTLDPCFAFFFFLKVTKSSCRGRLKENQIIICHDQLILEVKNLKSITSKKHHLNEKLWEIIAVPCYTQTTYFKILDLKKWLKHTDNYVNWFCFKIRCLLKAFGSQIRLVITSCWCLLYWKWDSVLSNTSPSKKIAEVFDLHRVGFNLTVFMWT